MIEAHIRPAEPLKSAILDSGIVMPARSVERGTEGFLGLCICKVYAPLWCTILAAGHMLLHLAHQEVLASHPQVRWRPGHAMGGACSGLCNVGPGLRGPVHVQLLLLC